MATSHNLNLNHQPPPPRPPPHLDCHHHPPLHPSTSPPTPVLLTTANPAANSLDARSPLTADHFGFPPPPHLEEKSRSIDVLPAWGGIKSGPLSRRAFMFSYLTRYLKGAFQERDTQRQKCLSEIQRFLVSGGDEGSLPFIRRHIFLMAI